MSAVRSKQTVRFDSVLPDKICQVKSELIHYIADRAFEFSKLTSILFTRLASFLHGLNIQGAHRTVVHVFRSLIFPVGVVPVLPELTATGNTFSKS